MKRLICLLLALLMPFISLAEGAVYNRTGNLDEEYVFPEGTPVLEIVFPACIPRTAPFSASAGKR